MSQSNRKFTCGKESVGLIGLPILFMPWKVLSVTIPEFTNFSASTAYFQPRRTNLKDSSMVGRNRGPQNRRIKVETIEKKKLLLAQQSKNTGSSSIIMMLAKMWRVAVMKSLKLCFYFSHIYMYIAIAIH